MLTGSSLRIGTVRGIEIRIQFSRLLTAGPMTWSLADGYFPELHPGWSSPTYYTAGAIAALLLFVSVVLHEFGHSLMAQRCGVPVRSTTLFIFGGVAAIVRFLQLRLLLGMGGSPAMVGAPRATDEAAVVAR